MNFELWTLNFELGALSSIRFLTEICERLMGTLNINLGSLIFNL